MPSPVKPSDFEGTLPSPTATLCDRFKGLLSFPRIFLEWFRSVYTELGEFTQSHKDMLKAATVPVGFVGWWARDNAPDGWLIITTGDYDRVQYAALFAVLGTTWGSSSPTTFKLPPAPGKVLVGADNATFAFGSSLGSATHTLTQNEIPILTVPYNQHTTEIPVAGTFGSPPNAKVGPFTDQVVNASGGQAHNNVQPSLVGHWIIKY